MAGKPGRKAVKRRGAATGCSGAQPPLCAFCASLSSVPASLSSRYANRQANTFTFHRLHPSRRHQAREATGIWQAEMAINGQATDGGRMAAAPFFFMQTLDEPMGDEQTQKGGATMKNRSSSGERAWREVTGGREAVKAYRAVSHRMARKKATVAKISLLAAYLASSARRENEGDALKLAVCCRMTPAMRRRSLCCHINLSSRHHRGCV